MSERLCAPDSPRGKQSLIPRPAPTTPRGTRSNETRTVSPAPAAKKRSSSVVPKRHGTSPAKLRREQGGDATSWQAKYRDLVPKFSELTADLTSALKREACLKVLPRLVILPNDVPETAFCALLRSASKRLRSNVHFSWKRSSRPRRNRRRTSSWRLG